MRFGSDNPFILFDLLQENADYSSLGICVNSNNYV